MTTLPSMTSGTDGIIVIDKPAGPTSHRIVDIARRVLGVRRIGHTGTLDPAATGVLVLCVGRAARLVEYMTGHDKRYRGTVCLGRATDTYDGAGQTVSEAEVDVDRDDLDRVLACYRGRIRQRPPAYSALKKDGRRAYELARKGKHVEMDAREVEVFSLDLIDWQPPEITLDVHCSSGTYIRSLAHDLGQDLGCGGHLSSLRRTACGQFSLGEAIPLSLFQAADTEERWRPLLLPIDAGLGDWPVLQLDEHESLLLETGRAIPFGNDSATGEPDRLYRALHYDGRFLGVVAADPDRQSYRPRKVFL